MATRTLLPTVPQNRVGGLRRQHAISITLRTWTDSGGTGAQLVRQHGRSNVSSARAAAEIRVRHAGRRAGRARRAIDSVVCAAPSSAAAGSTAAFSRVRINSYAGRDSILFENVQIGRHCRIKKAIIDKHVIVPPGTTSVTSRHDQQRGFAVTEQGVVVIPKAENIESFLKRARCGRRDRRAPQLGRHGRDGAGVSSTAAVLAGRASGIPGEWMWNRTRPPPMLLAGVVSPTLVTDWRCGGYGLVRGLAWLAWRCCRS